MISSVPLRHNPRFFIEGELMNGPIPSDSHF